MAAQTWLKTLLSERSESEEKSLRLDWTLSKESSGVQSSRSPAPASESELDAMPRGAAE